MTPRLLFFVLLILAFVFSHFLNERVDEESRTEQSNSHDSETANKTTTDKDDTDKDDTSRYERFEYETEPFGWSDDKEGIINNYIHSVYSIGHSTSGCKSEFINIFDYVYINDRRLHDITRLSKVITLDESNDILQAINKSNIDKEENVVLNFCRDGNMGCAIYDLEVNPLYLQESSFQDTPDLVYLTNGFFSDVIEKIYLDNGYSRTYISWKNSEDDYYNNGYLFYRCRETLSDIVGRIENTKLHGGSSPRIFKESKSEERIEHSYFKMEMFINFDKNRRDCIKEMRQLNKELKMFREYEDREAIKLDDKDGLIFTHKFHATPVLSLDLHGFRHDSGMRAVNMFLNKMLKYGVDRFSIIYGWSGNTIKKVTKKAFKNFAQKRLTLRNTTFAIRKYT